MCDEGEAKHEDPARSTLRNPGRVFVRATLIRRERRYATVLLTPGRIARRFGARRRVVHLMEGFSSWRITDGEAPLRGALVVDAHAALIRGALDHGSCTRASLLLRRAARCLALGTRGAVPRRRHGAAWWTSRAPSARRGRLIRHVVPARLRPGWRVAITHLACLAVALPLLWFAPALARAAYRWVVNDGRVAAARPLGLDATGGPSAPRVDPEHARCDDARAPACERWRR